MRQTASWEGLKCPQKLRSEKLAVDFSASISIMNEFVENVGSMDFYQIRGKQSPDVDKPVKRCRRIAKFCGAYSAAVAFYLMHFSRSDFVLG